MNQPLPSAPPHAPQGFLRTTPHQLRPAARASLWLVLSVYVALVVYIVFLARRRSLLVWTPDLVNLVPLMHTIHDHADIVDIGFWNYWSNIFGNIGLFLPLPTLVAGVTRLRGRWALFGIGVAVSVCIECTQYVLKDGVPDIDDVLLNSTGVLLGLWLWQRLFRKVLRRLSI